ncbi:helix-turn-helix domain-containing protein [Spongiactinospora sp. 9N601]|uniref:helix-turn-helix domain-containing protein n=1 Tax=Spongiactinospora sp. 9N601 TaxID=3375149 RepID=UPI00379C2CB5
MPVAKTAEVTFTSADRIRDVIHNFNPDGFDSFYPKYKGGRPRTFSLLERREIKKIAKSRSAEHDLPLSTWSLAELADFLVAQGGGRRHQPRGSAGPAPRGGRLVSTHNDLGDLPRPRLRRQEGPHRAPLRDRRRRGHTRGRRA